MNTSNRNIEADTSISVAAVDVIQTEAVSLPDAAKSLNSSDSIAIQVFQKSESADAGRSLPISSNPDLLSPKVLSTRLTPIKSGVNLRYWQRQLRELELSPISSPAFPQSPATPSRPASTTFSSPTDSPQMPSNHSLPSLSQQSADIIPCIFLFRCVCVCVRGLGGGEGYISC